VAAARALDSRVVPEVELLKGSFERRVEEVGRSAAAVSLLGLTALLLACVGTFGLVAYAVSQRTREIGIRMALGAPPSNVLTVVLQRFSGPVVVGTLLGIGGAAGLSQILRGQLFGLSTLDPAAYLSALGVFAVAVALAAWLPARRALRVDPMRALRCE